MKTQQKSLRRQARARRSHATTRTSGRTRLIVYRSNRTIYAQLINDITGKIIGSASGLKSKASGIKAAEEVGTNIAKIAKAKKINDIAFDRNGYKYHGQVKAVAEKAREAGLTF